jgi:hypothetical protein
MPQELAQAHLNRSKTAARQAIQTRIDLYKKEIETLKQQIASLKYAIEIHDKKERLDKKAYELPPLKAYEPPPVDTLERTDTLLNADLSQKVDTYVLEALIQEREMLKQQFRLQSTLHERFPLGQLRQTLSLKQKIQGNEDAIATVNARLAAFKPLGLS